MFEIFNYYPDSRSQSQAHDANHHKFFSHGLVHQVFLNKFRKTLTHNR